MDKYLLPYPVRVVDKSGSFTFRNPTVSLAPDCDARVDRALGELVTQFADKFAAREDEITVSHGESHREDYQLKISADRIEIKASSAAGAFYAVQTLRQLLMQGREIPCMEIYDAPEFAYRGFYHDVTRGRIPTVATLKELIDKAAMYKLNSFQIYVEHSFAFREYEEANRGQEPLTADEIREIDAYCRERFIDFVPSLSCFGHLYALLETDKYKHLCELENYVPREHLWSERMGHHTIDVSNPESFELICSLIDQYMPLFSSQYFNICCDETFDLGRGRNQGKDTGELYVGFVSKLIDYIESKGKTAMLWGDIVLQHFDRAADISEKAVLLNWTYNRYPSFDNVQKFREAGKTQIVCPGVSCWSRTVEYLPDACDNIRSLVAFAKICGAKGVLNTGWGDSGHMCDPRNVACGLILGAAESWNPGGAGDEYFKEAVCVLNYRNMDKTVVDLIYDINRADDCYALFYFRALHTDLYVNGVEPAADRYDVTTTAWRVETLERVEEKILALMDKNDIDPDSAYALLLGARGTKEIIKLFAAFYGYDGFDRAEFDQWLEEYAADWKQHNKKDELPILIDFFEKFEDTLAARQSK